MMLFSSPGVLFVSFSSLELRKTLALKSHGVVWVGVGGKWWWSSRALLNG